MKTIHTSLPVYDSLAKQCFERAKCSRQVTDPPVPIKCPQHRLPSMQWNVEDDDPGMISSVLLVEQDGTETEIRSKFIMNQIDNPAWAVYTNAGYDVFASPNYYTVTAQKTVAAGEVYAFSDSFAVTKGYPLWFNYNLTLNSGTAPLFVVVNAAGDDITTPFRLEAGNHSVNIISVSESAAAARIRIRSLDTELTNFSLGVSILKSCLPDLHVLTDTYFVYNGDPLMYGNPIDVGIYYLKMESNGGYIYYSDWFEVDCVYPNLITAWANSEYETFTSTGTRITSAINTAASGLCKASPDISVIKGESITIIFYLTLNSGDAPLVVIHNIGWTLGDDQLAVDGLNEITLTTTWSGLSQIRLYNNATNTNFSTSEILVMRTYSEKYLTLNFSNVCDLGDILYSEGFTQTIWFESETMEPSFPLLEEGQNNGEGRFVRTFGRQVKKYMIRTMAMPDFMADVFYRLILHDTISLIDLVGDENTVYNVEVEHEWLENDKYYVRFNITLDYNEAFVVAGCCNNFAPAE